MKAQSVAELEGSAAKGDVGAKKELARRLMEGDGTDKDEAAAAKWLEDCAAHGDAEAMVMLAKCCALGCGKKQSGEQAEALISEAAKKGNAEALCFRKYIDKWRGHSTINYEGLCCTVEYTRTTTFMSFIAELFRGQFIMGYVATVMNIVPCQAIKLGRRFQSGISSAKKSMFIWIQWNRL